MRERGRERDRVRVGEERAREKRGVKKIYIYIHFSLLAGTMDFLHQHISAGPDETNIITETEAGHFNLRAIKVRRGCYLHKIFISTCMCLEKRGLLFPKGLPSFCLCRRLLHKINNVHFSDLLG